MSAADRKLQRSIYGSVQLFHNIRDIAARCQDGTVSEMVSDREALIQAQLLRTSLQTASIETEQLIHDIRRDVARPI